MVDGFPAFGAEFHRLSALSRHLLAHRKSRFALTSVAALPDAVDLPAAIRAALITSTDHLTGPLAGSASSGPVEHPAAIREQIADLADAAIATETALVQHIRSAMR